MPKEVEWDEKCQIERWRTFGLGYYLVSFASKTSLCMKVVKNIENYWYFNFNWYDTIYWKTSIFKRPMPIWYDNIDMGDIAIFSIYRPTSRLNVLIERFAAKCKKPIFLWYRIFSNTDTDTDEKYQKMPNTEDKTPKIPKVSSIFA